MATKELKGTHFGVVGGRDCCTFGGDCSIAQHPHAGVDVCANTGANIHALADGVVWRSRNGGVQGYHQEITIKYDVRRVSRFVDYIYVLYGHVLKDSILPVGKVVKRGDVIARVGTREDAMGTPPHSHIEMWINETHARNYLNEFAQDPRHIRKVLEPEVILEGDNPDHEVSKPPPKSGLIPVGTVPKQIAEPPVNWLGAARNNYSVASRTEDDVWLCVLHSTESGQSDDGTGDANWFANPASGVSAHYTAGTSGRITKSVRVRDIAYTNGNWSVNQGSVSIEIDGKASLKDTPFAQKVAVAKLFRFVCGYFEVPMQLGFDTKDVKRRTILRAGLIGHCHVPGADHTDPGFSTAEFEEILKIARSL